MDENTQKNREFRKRVLDRIASDPEFRRQLVDDPNAALEKAGFTTNGSDNDVSAYGMLDALTFGGLGTEGHTPPVPPVPAPGAVPDPFTCPPHKKETRPPAP